MTLRAFTAAFTLTLLGLFAFDGAAPPTALAGVACEHTPVTQWEIAHGGNGHFYQGVCSGDDSSWDDANAGAEAIGGHLVSITSADENDFVFDLINARGLWFADISDNWCAGPLIGAFEPDGTDEPAGGWEWSSGEPFDYDNWAPGEPNNNAGVDENRALFGNGDCGPAFNASDEWHDIGEEDGARSFVVEWDTQPPTCENSPLMEWPVSEGGNGHFYMGVCAHGRVTWQDARSRAEDASGHLATILSDEENDFVFELIDTPGLWNLTSYACIVGPWIGGLQPDGSEEPAGGWEWLTGEPFGYDNWNDDEPDDFDEDDAIVFWGGCPEPGRSSGWADLVSSADGQVTSYVVEWDVAPHIQGDADCDRDVELDDAANILGSAAGVSENGACPAAADVDVQGLETRDVDCDLSITAIDVLNVLLYVAELDQLTVPVGCAAVGDPINT